MNANGYVSDMIVDDEHRKLSRAIKQSERDLTYDSREGRETVRKLFGVAMHDAGTELAIGVAPDNLHLFERDTGAALG